MTIDAVHLALAVTLAALAGLMLSEWRGVRAGVWVAKPLASLGFCAIGVAAGGLERGAPGHLMLAALGLSLAGDVLLIPHHKKAFLAGLFAFLAGHLCFAAAFVVGGVDWRWSGAAAPLLLVAVALTGRWLMPKVEAKMRAPVIAYMLVVSAMVVFAVGTAARAPAPARWLVPVAAVAFWLSDLSVAIDRFVKRGFVNRAWGLPLYYGAQILFALSLRQP